MDERTEVINNILISMQNDLSEEQLTHLQQVLYIELNDYEIQKRCTALIPMSDSPEMILRKFIATKRIEGKSENTLKQYYWQCSHMLYAINKDISEITTYDLRFYLAEYQKQRGVSNRTLENMRKYISSFFSWLTDEGMITKNPAASIKKIKYEKEVLYPFSTTELEKLRRACTTTRDRAIVEFLYATGCRVSEMVALDRNDINWNDKNAIVHGKGNKQRTVFLNDIVLLYLKEYLDARTDDDPCLFASKRETNSSRRLSKSGVESMLHKLGDRAGVQDVHPHRFRRTFATNMINRGAPVQDIATILGHEDINTTMVYYSNDQSNIEFMYNKYMK